MRKLIVFVVTALLALVAAGSSVSTLGQARPGPEPVLCGYCGDGGAPPFACTDQTIGIYAWGGAYWLCGPPWIYAGPVG